MRCGGPRLYRQGQRSGAFLKLTYYALQPDIKVIAPWRDWEYKGRTDLIAYAQAHGNFGERDDR